MHTLPGPHRSDRFRRAGRHSIRPLTAALVSLAMTSSLLAAAPPSQATVPPATPPVLEGAIDRSVELTSSTTSTTTYDFDLNNGTLADYQAQPPTSPMSGRTLRAVLVSPADSATNAGLTPTLKAAVSEPEAGLTYYYKYTVCQVGVVGGSVLVMIWPKAS